jgi:hypothetical protein
MAESGLGRSLVIFRSPDAAAIASELFHECFGFPFPVPRDNALPIPTPPQAWRQFVATYRWPDGKDEAVGFCNWIRYKDFYLQGGMCVRRSFYRRLPREQFREVQGQGGLAQMMMAAAARELDDCIAWFGYCGDAKALAVDLRAGYETTHRKYVIAKWFRSIDGAERERLVDEVAKIGPF